MDLLNTQLRLRPDDNGGIGDTSTDTETLAGGGGGAGCDRLKEVLDTSTGTKSVSEEGEDYGILRSKSTVKKGLLWQQRDKIFSQWKERYFILTTDYLQCFKKGSSKVTEMGEFIFKVRRHYCSGCHF